MCEIILAVVSNKVRRNTIKNTTSLFIYDNKNCFSLLRVQFLHVMKNIIAFFSYFFSSLSPTINHVKRLPFFLIEMYTFYIRANLWKIQEIIITQE
jgi:hypothetical protein